MKSFLKGFVYAGHGIWLCLRQERNFRIHLVAAAYVLCFAPAFSLTRAEWAVLLLTIFVVIAAEGINTAIEMTMDLLSPARHHMARAAKDMAAGAVLVCAVGAVFVGISLFWRPAVLLKLWTGLTGQPWRLFLLIISLLPALWLIVYGGVPKPKNDSEKDEKQQNLKR